MPHKCRILGANSVTNIDLSEGFLPAPIIRNADWFENLTPVRPSEATVKPG